ncbi:MAG TPA: hydroxyacylglutathione hydrolase [Azoarcus sp.]|nr:hydroxyacylglutathione hydrolase [Azoarcus sp.]
MSIHASGSADLEVLPLPAFNDNYIWVLVRDRKVAVVDPGDATVVEDFLARTGFHLTAILITHHHTDHTGGIHALTERHAVPVFGPAAANISGVTVGVSEGDQVALPEHALSLTVLEVPGHTKTHIAFYAPGLLFPGDTLFSAGCGRVLGGTIEQLHRSLERLKTLPGDSRVYGGHEYTLANLRFARAAEPDNPERDAWFAHCERLRAENKPTLPSTMDQEVLINPFLRTDSPEILASLERHTGKRPHDSQACFSALRAWKDVF